MTLKMQGQDSVESSLETVFKKINPITIEHLAADFIDQSSDISPDSMGKIIDVLFQKISYIWLEYTQFLAGGLGFKYLSGHTKNLKIEMTSSVRPDCSHVYIYFFRLILGFEVKTPSGESLKFKDLVQMRCQSHLIELLQKNERSQNCQNRVLKCEGENLLAFTTFISDMYNHDGITLETVWACLKSLLAVEGELPLLCVCRLLKGVGKFLDSNEGKAAVDEIFSKFYQIIRDNTCSTEISFMLCNLCDLRKNKWNPKSIQLSTFKIIKNEISPGSAPTSKLAACICEPAARPSQEGVVRNKENIPQTMKMVNGTQTKPVEEGREDIQDQAKSSRAFDKNSPEKIMKSEIMNLRYEEGQWSPTNLQGKKKYHRGFLLQIRPYCTTRPKELPLEFPALEHCRLDEENGQFKERQGTSGFTKEDERLATSSSTSAGQRKTTLSSDHASPRNKEETGQDSKTKKVQSSPEANGEVMGKASVGNTKQGEAVSKRGRREENGPSSLPTSFSLSTGSSTHKDNMKMNSCNKESQKRSCKSSQLQSKCKSLPPCGMYNEQNSAKVTGRQESALKKGQNGKETKQEKKVAEKGQCMSSNTSVVGGSEISSQERSEPPLSEEEYETRVERILVQYQMMNNGEAVKSQITKLQTPYLQHIFIRLSIGRVVDGHEKSSEAIGRLFHELLSSGTISEEQFCKGLNDYLVVTEQIAGFTQQYWSNLGEIIGAMVLGGTTNLGFLKEVIQTTPGDGKAAVFMAEILKACNKFTGNLYQILRLWKTSNFSWSFFIADKWNIKPFVEKQNLDFTLSPEERNARKPSDQVPLRSESNSVTRQGAGENGRARQTEKNSIPKFQNDLMLLLKGNHLQHKTVFNYIDNAIDEVSRKSKEFIHALVLAVCLSSMVEGDDGPYTKCQRELLKRKAVLIQRYIRGTSDFEMVVLQVVGALSASLGNPRGVLRTMCEVLFDEDVISEETFMVWRESDDFSEENYHATKKFFESLDQD